MLLTGWEAYFFYALAITALMMAFQAISTRSPVHCAMYLISTLVSTAGLFLLLQAEFVAGVQVLVYVGGVMVLFLFVVMLVKQRNEEAQAMFSDQTILATIVALFLGLTLLGVVIGTQRTAFFKPPKEATVPVSVKSVHAPTGTISNDSQLLGQALYTTSVLPFEIASVLLLVAIVGAVVLARDRKQEDQFEAQTSQSAGGKS
ncbi:MAG TPA: NADH-quinone oxidoreductase subunit J [Acidobacteriota bacterium]|nr:NADH-quinone oxidoreductase subunit J [Acidobacteriota bacterium]HNB70435.1 NADH-quinone oxidoreductase subunit J [Acidobacteriota bacterium]HNC42636.1 NADH-quinone oxidoreductase subunit J [Acidobacteriota bacterium]HND21701.1 NADH-quinone oxidoreductase subunit J [Acidobacteriota bacterium]HNG91350.1 NADH-quinone oxidoreductase subunit J [Acidobacteriota bacterium]